MISDLKKRTAGRDMYKVLSQMEGREITPPPRRQGNRNYSPSSPPPEPRNGKKTEPSYGRAKYGAQNRYSSEEDDRADNFSSSRFGGSKFGANRSQESHQPRSTWQGQYNS